MLKTALDVVGTRFASYRAQPIVLDRWLLGPRPSPPLPRDVGAVFEAPHQVRGFFFRTPPLHRAPGHLKPAEPPKRIDQP